MAATPSTMVPLGTDAPDFDLPDYAGHHVRLSDFSDHKALLVMFVCNHCPFVVHVHKELAYLYKDYSDQGLGMVAINSNDIENYPEDSPENMRLKASEWGWEFPYLFDESQEVAKSYSAACTPDFFLFDANRKLVYRGQLDDSRPNNGIPVSGSHLRRAIECVLRGEMPDGEQIPSIGCNIKWKPGCAPPYAVSSL
jgi:peroxiredoxin